MEDSQKQAQHRTQHPQQSNISDMMVLSNLTVQRKGRDKFYATSRYYHQQGATITNRVRDLWRLSLRLDVGKGVGVDYFNFKLSWKIYQDHENDQSFSFRYKARSRNRDRACQELADENEEPSLGKKPFKYCKIIITIQNEGDLHVITLSRSRKPSLSCINAFLLVTLHNNSTNVLWEDHSVNVKSGQRSAKGR